MSDTGQDTKRDYSKFLDDNGHFNIRVMPRPDYTRMVNEYRAQEHVIREVFGELFWLWDYEQLEKQEKDEGREPVPAELAQKVLNTMDDKEWWEVMSRFERHFNKHFSENPERWAEVLDPVYDDQERAGWTRRQ